MDATDFRYQIPQEQLESVSSSTKLKRKKVIVIAGPTGSGKSSLAIKLADCIGGEIISADAIQVYKGMDIGTAKTPLC